jgi:hypothetical protein
MDEVTVATERPALEQMVDLQRMATSCGSS